MSFGAFFRLNAAWRTCRTRVPAPPNLDTQAFNTIPVIEYGPFCPRQPHPQPVINCDDGRSRACALSLARRFDMSRCSNCFGWMSSLQPPQSRIVLTLLSIYYMSVISNDLIAQLKPSKLRLVLLRILIATYLFLRQESPMSSNPSPPVVDLRPGFFPVPKQTRFALNISALGLWWLSSNCVEHTNHSSLLAGWTSCPLDQACISNG